MNFNLLTEKALSKGFKSIEIYQEIKSGCNIKVFKKEVASSTTFETNVCAVRAVIKNKVGMFYTENLDESNYDFILDSIKENTKVITTKEPYFFYKGDKAYKELPSNTSDFDNYTMKDKIDLCLSLEEGIYAKHKTVSLSNVSYSEVKSTFVLKNSNGLDLTKSFSYATIYGDAVCKKANDVKNGYDYQVVKNFSEFNIPTLVKNAVEKTVKSLNATSIPSGQYPVVLDKDVAGNLLEVFSSLFSAESVIRGTTFLADKLETKIFGDNINLLDDPMFKKAFIQSNFDDEGVKAKKTTLVENGVLKSFLHNLKTAKMLKTKSTSNGFKPGVSANIAVVPSNMYIKPEKNKTKDLYTKCDNGVLITSLAGLHSGVNSITGDFNLQASGFKIEGGKVTTGVTLIVLSGNIKDLYNNVEMIANDLEFKGGNVASPSLLIKSMSISGQN